MGGQEKQAGKKVWPVSAILLAAGCSRRMGSSNKLLLTWKGEPLVRAVAGRFANLPFLEVILVTGFQAEAVTRAVQGLPLRVVFNPHFLEGMAASIRTGVSAASPGAGGLLLCPTDLPLLSEAIIKKLTREFLSSGCQKIVCPVTPEGQRNPVIFPVLLKKALLELKGDRGAKAVLHAHAQLVQSVYFDRPMAFLDVDSGSDLQRLKQLA